MSVNVTHNGAPVPANVAKEVLQAVGDLARHPAFHQMLAHAPGMDGVKADDAIAKVTGAISEASLNLSAPTMNGRSNGRSSLRMMAMAGAPDAPAPTGSAPQHLALETPRVSGRPLAPPVG